MSSIATVSVQNFPFASTKTSFLRPSPQLKDVRKLTISSTKMQSRSLLIFCTLQGTNNKTKKNMISTLSSISQKLLYDAINIISSPIQTPTSPVDSSSHDFGGNFAPVEELEPTDCEVIEGEIPLSLNGVYIRNGPNLQHHQPRHLLDFFFGDGMLHSLKLSNGKATYCSRYVKTYKYLLEREAGFPIVPSGTSLNKMVNIFRFLRL
ncbi:Carotenoid oxygenase [Corchorus capsularis]|uniref:Carotenoid oxygenase n=1 Tax=Corchorus capsularis TaxID=210143 RepID=A0A1R3KDK0_COCAP|nr:Carotenoid oxygenase [Corchorus capsularis]